MPSVWNRNVQNRWLRLRFLLKWKLSKPRRKAGFFDTIDIMLKKIEYFYFFLWFIAICILWSRMFYFDGMYYWAGWVYVWGDWQMHIPIILNFAYRPFPLPSHPLLSGEPFRYHFAADMISGFLMKLGVSLQYATYIPSVIFSILLVIAVYYFFFAIYKKKLTAIISSLLFFFNGGLGLFIYTYRQIIQKNFFPPSPSLIEFTKLPSYGIDWMNIWTSSFIPQRPILLGAPLTIFTLIFLWKIHDEGIQKKSKSLLILFGILTGLMPIIQIHSFFVIQLVAGFVFLILLAKERLKALPPLLFFYIPSLVIAAFIFWYFFEGFPQSSYQLSFHWNGISSITSFIRFWILNAGVMFFLIPYAFIKSNTKLKLFYIPFLLLFILANTFLFQGTYLDNKFLLYWYLLSAGIAGNVLTNMFSLNNRKHIYVGIILMYLSISSGFTDFVSLFNHDRQKHRLFSHDLLQFDQKVRSLTGPEDVFLTAAANTWLGMTLGRQIVMTWEDWLISHGIHTDQRKKDIEDIYTNNANTRKLLKKYAIDYIILSPVERLMYAVDEAYFQQIGPPIFQYDSYEIYDVRGVHAGETIPQISE